MTFLIAIKTFNVLVYFFFTNFVIFLAFKATIFGLAVFTPIRNALDCPDQAIMRNFL
jgi:hypothetical protein